jgi:hypothetical protein
VVSLAVCPERHAVSCHICRYDLINILLAPRSVARHYFDEHLETMSEGGDPLATPYTPYSTYSTTSPAPSELNTLEDISPDAL